MTPEQLEKIEDAFYNDLSNSQACSLAGITTDEFLTYIGQHTDDGWFARMQLLRHARVAQAEVNLGESIKHHSVEDSKFVLERRNPEKWAKKDKMQHEGQLEWKVSVAPFMLPENRREVIDVEAKPMIEPSCPK